MLCCYCLKTSVLRLLVWRPLMVKVLSSIRPIWCSWSRNNTPLSQNIVCILISFRLHLHRHVIVRWSLLLQKYIHLQQQVSNSFNIWFQQLSLSIDPKVPYVFFLLTLLVDSSHYFENTYKEMWSIFCIVLLISLLMSTSSWETARVFTKYLIYFCFVCLHLGYLRTYLCRIKSSSPEEDIYMKLTIKVQGCLNQQVNLTLWTTVNLRCIKGFQTVWWY